MIKKFLPIIASILGLYLIWCFISPGLHYHSIKRFINDLHSQDAFTRDKLEYDEDLIDEIILFAEEKGIYAEQIDIKIERNESNRLKYITIDYSDYVVIFGYDVLQRNYTYLSRLIDRRQSL